MKNMEKSEEKKAHIPLHPGSLFCGYEVIGLIGRGGYGEVFHVKDSISKKDYAMKCELVTAKKTALEPEINTLKRISASNLPYFPKYVSDGQEGDIIYLIMELLGPSLSKLHKTCPDSHFSPSTFVKTAIEMINCIKALHELGIIHRDVKPSNFLLRGGRENFLVLADYGLVKDYADPFTHEHLPMNTKKSFKGTLKYCSMHVHHGMDQSRRDDMLSWFYSVVELYLCDLLWSDTKDKAVVQRNKKSFSDNMSNYLPKQLVEIYHLLENLDFTDTPEYDKYEELISSLGVSLHCDFSLPLDWELFDEQLVKKISVFPLNKGPNPPPFEDEQCIETVKTQESSPIVIGKKHEIAEESTVCLLI